MLFQNTIAALKRIEKNGKIIISGSVDTIKESNNAIWLGEVNKPTVQVNITRDITLGFINKYKDLIKIPKSRSKIDAALFLTVLDKTNLRLLQQIL